MAVRPDNRLEDGAMQPVECTACGACVLVRKSSWEQTSLQWSGEAIEACLERRAASPRSGPNGAAFSGCGSLRDSVTAAVNRGDVTVQIEDPLKTNPEAAHADGAGHGHGHGQEHAHA
ncbi:hypothetical protein [Nocardioides sp. AE5]|uniref:hypothetical protein n=1 Tax=Nocardioides sp. AE5 TaxID=2962573 RepID=UPI0028811B6A|nr:hypothetical protein [Nocardioides sp. AE5]MDT0203170.1 hypothetical protein [Nocardioides sp. AE5]